MTRIKSKTSLTGTGFSMRQLQHSSHSYGSFFRVPPVIPYSSNINFYFQHQM